jgi:hypothetical protein
VEFQFVGKKKLMTSIDLITVKMFVKILWLYYWTTDIDEGF